MTILRRRSDKVDMLKQIPLFASLSQKDLMEVARRADGVEVAKGTVVVAVRRNNRRISLHDEGEVLGEMSLIDGKPRSASLRVESDANLLVIHRHDFRYLIDNLPGFDRKLLISLSARLREMDKALDH